MFPTYMQSQGNLSAVAQARGSALLHSYDEANDETGVHCDES